MRAAFLQEQGDRGTVRLICDFKPDIGFVHKLSVALQAVQSVKEFSHWSVNPSRATISDVREKVLMIVDHRHVELHLAGLLPWCEHVNVHARHVVAAIQAFGQDECKSVQLAVGTYLDLGMTHSEMATLFFDEFSPGRDQWDDICPGVNDAFVRLIARDESTYLRELAMGPMTADEVRDDLRRSSLHAIAGDDPFSRPLTTWRDTLAVDCFHICSTQHKAKLSILDLQQWLVSATEDCDARISRAAARLMSLTAPKEQSNG